MKKERFEEDQVIAILKEGASGAPVKSPQPLMPGFVPGASVTRLE